MHKFAQIRTNTHNRALAGLYNCAINFCIGAVNFDTSKSIKRWV